MRSTRRGLIFSFLPRKNSDGHQSKKTFICIGVGVRGTCTCTQIYNLHGYKRAACLVSLLIKIVSRGITKPDKNLLGQVPHFCVDVGWRFDCTHLFVGAVEEYIVL